MLTKKCELCNLIKNKTNFTLLNSIFRTLSAEGKYNFDENKVFLEFWDKTMIDYSPVSIFVTSLHNRKKFKEAQPYVINKADKLTKNKDSKTFIFKIPITDINVFHKRFTVQISYIFLTDINAQLFSSEYSFGVSLLSLIEIRKNKY